MEIAKIKIGRKDYQPKEGDYIQYNGSVYLFCAGDGRTLKRDGWTLQSNLSLSKRAVKLLPLDKMRKTEHENKYTNIQIARWFY
jgi:hypothetical protein